MTVFHRVVLINVSALACVAAASVYGFAVSGSGDGSVAVPVPDARTAGYCRALHDALPDRLQGLPRNDPSPGSELVAGWGDPAIVLRCGVPRPAADDDPNTSGMDVQGVGWSLETGSRGSVVLTTTLRQVYVELRLPKKWATGLDAAEGLAEAIRTTVPTI